MTRPLQAALVVVLLIAAATIGYGAYRLLWHSQQPSTGSPATGSTANSSGGTAGEVTSDGSAAADLGAGPAAAGAGLPERRPVFSLKDRDGRVRSITEWDGKSLVINFWATWCAPCRREIPMLNALHTARAGENVEVIGIAVDFRERVLEYVREVRIAYPLLIGEQDGLDALEQFGISAAGFPLTVFTDNEGRIVSAHLGELHAAEADVILDVVADLNAGKIALAAGQQRIRAGLESVKKNANTSS